MKLPKKNVYAICDFETTGLDPVKDHPIEVALLFCDHELTVLRAYESLIWCPQEVFTMEAFAVHKILLRKLLTAPIKSKVAGSIATVCEDFKQRIVLVSDNAQFEHGFMKQLFPVVWPFHYCAWDTNLFLEATGVGDPVPVHRAMGDVGRLHAHLREALRLSAVVGCNIGPRRLEP